MKKIVIFNSDRMNSLTSALVDFCSRIRSDQLVRRKRITDIYYFISKCTISKIGKTTYSLFRLIGFVLFSLFPIRRNPKNCLFLIKRKVSNLKNDVFVEITNRFRIIIIIWVTVHVNNFEHFEQICEQFEFRKFCNFYD